ncbi:hypothetical protein B0H14DRAFT_2601267 [Mycena olivaceomarginata]|nr:hypothetical protein B0H14DRAFT_2601267 [Mycena olivaceomarginata]
MRSVIYYGTDARKVGERSTIEFACQGRGAHPVAGLGRDRGAQSMIKTKPREGRGTRHGVGLMRQITKSPIHPQKQLERTGLGCALAIGLKHQGSTIRDRPEAREGRRGRALSTMGSVHEGSAACNETDAREGRIGAPSMAGPRREAEVLSTVRSRREKEERRGAPFTMGLRRKQLFSRLDLSARGEEMHAIEARDKGAVGSGVNAREERERRAFHNVTETQAVLAAFGTERERRGEEDFPHWG